MQQHYVIATALVVSSLILSLSLRDLAEKGRYAIAGISGERVVVRLDRKTGEIEVCPPRRATDQEARTTALRIACDGGIATLPRQ